MYNTSLVIQSASSGISKVCVCVCVCVFFLFFFIFYTLLIPDDTDLITSEILYINFNKLY